MKNISRNKSYYKLSFNATENSDYNYLSGTITNYIQIPRELNHINPSNQC